MCYQESSAGAQLRWALFTAIFIFYYSTDIYRPLIGRETKCEEASSPSTDYVYCQLLWHFIIIFVFCCSLLAAQLVYFISHSASRSLAVVFSLFLCWPFPSPRSDIDGYLSWGTQNVNTQYRFVYACCRMFLSLFGRSIRNLTCCLSFGPPISFFPPYVCLNILSVCTHKRASNHLFYDCVP